MKNNIRALFIAPYEGMREPILEAARDYPEIDLTITVGNEADGQRIAEESYYGDYDCVISRGNTAAMIRRAVALPVVEIRVTPYDILGSLKPLGALPARAALVGYANIIHGAEYLSLFFPFELKICAFQSAAELPGIFADLRKEGITTAVCDARSFSEIAGKGFDAYLLRSGSESIAYAFREVLSIHNFSNSVMERNKVLQRLVSANSESETVVFSSDRRLYYSSLAENDYIVGYLKEHLADFEYSDKFRLVKQNAGYLYRISAKKLTVNGEKYYAFFSGRKKASSQNEHRSIAYRSERDIREEMEKSVFGVANIKRYYSSELENALLRNNPVLIFGEVGVGKNHLAQLIYLSSAYIKNPFVIIDFSRMTDRAWDYLINKEDSPLYDIGNTLFFKNIDAISDDRLRRFLTALQDGDVPKRNRIIISCSSQRGLSSRSSVPVLKLVTQLECIVVSMLPLRGQPEKVKNSVELLLQDFRDKMNIPVGAVTEDAMERLMSYPWPQNYDQLIRVVEKAGMIAEASPVTLRVVEEALTGEAGLAQGDTGNTVNTILDLTKPLEEINREVARLILEENGGNQSAAAKSLGISRTTLWRMLKNG